MFWKLAVMVLTIGGTGCGLLVLRQQQIDLLAAETDLLREAGKLEKKLQMTRWELDQLTQDVHFERWFEEAGIEIEPIDRVSPPPRIQAGSISEEDHLTDKIALGDPGRQGTSW
ncbi:MAG: hypothetical protein GY895_07835 [Phycisphaera sp.]|nr:hypothetical protein [Phycisphaera sp.]